MSDAGESEAKPRPPWSRWLTSETVVVAIISGFAAWTVAVGKDRELDIKYVEIGIAILRADPRDENAAKIRQWAIDILRNVNLQRKKERSCLGMRYRRRAITLMVLATATIAVTGGVQIEKIPIRPNHPSSALRP